MNENCSPWRAIKPQVVMLERWRKIGVTFPFPGESWPQPSGVFYAPHLPFFYVLHAPNEKSIRVIDPTRKTSNLQNAAACRLSERTTYAITQLVQEPGRCGFTLKRANSCYVKRRNLVIVKPEWVCVCLCKSCLASVRSWVVVVQFMIPISKLTIFPMT